MIALTNYETANAIRRAIRHADVVTPIHWYDRAHTRNGVVIETTRHYSLNNETQGLINRGYAVINADKSAVVLTDLAYHDLYLYDVMIRAAYQAKEMAETVGIEAMRSAMRESNQ